MHTIRFDCTVTTSDNTSEKTPLQVAVLLNNTVVWPAQSIVGPTPISFEISDEETQEQTVTIQVSGKQAEHTQVDDNGNVVSDVALTFGDFKLDDVDLTSIIQHHPMQYSHDFNGYGDPTVENFYDYAGCNGTIEFKFTTPFYLWLLENM